MTDVAPANPFEHASVPEEPPRGTVIAYQRLTASGLILDYLSFRAGNGQWYTTGEETRQRVSWDTLWGVIRVNAHGSIRYATAWAEMDLPRPALIHTRDGSHVTITPPFADQVRDYVLGARPVTDRPQA